MVMSLLGACHRICEETNVRQLVPTLAALSCMAVGWTAETETINEHLDEILITSSRIDDAMVGASTTIIDAETIQNAPAQHLPDLISYQSGVQFRDLFSGTGGAGAKLDMRGFGASSVANTLILLNGRRLNDIDLGFVDLGNIPIEVVQRIEIIRGNAGAVLYGDGAVGGVVNIITANGYGDEPSGTVEFKAGSDEFLQGNVTYAQDVNNTSVLAFASITDSDSYRDNNDIERQNLMVDARYWGDRYDIFLNISYHDQEMRTPGGRIVDEGAGTDEVADDPRGTSTPDDYANRDGYAFTVGSNYAFSENLEGVFDIGFRTKDQHSALIAAFGDQFGDTTLDTWSFTPRVTYSGDIGNNAWESINGIDLYLADYDSKRRVTDGGDPFHHFTAEQSTMSIYSQNTVSIQEQTHIGFGLRLEYFDFSGEDDFDASVTLFPSPAGKLEDTDEDDTEFAAHLGVDHDFNDNYTMFGRIGRSFRLPTIDERAASNPDFPFPADASFDLEVQTSVDFEIGVRAKQDNVKWQASAYWMDLEDELHFDSDLFLNVNLDPTERYGIEAQGEFEINSDWSLFAAASYTIAEFTEGTFEGKDVPLVAPYTVTLTAQYTLNEWFKGMLVINHVSERRMDNDQLNTQPKIPDYTIVDLKVSGTYNSWRGSLSINNILDEDYFTEAIASTFTPNRYNAFPLAGTTFMAAVAYTY